MICRSLELSYFRNYEQLLVGLSEGINLFLGFNGQGKTNLIEALSFTFSGRSFRATEINSLIHWNSPNQQALVRAKAEVGSLNYSIFATISESQRKYSLNNKSVRRTGLQETFSFLVFSPESLSSIKLGPEARRKLVDQAALLLFPEASDLFARFNKALKTRNRLLKEHRQNLKGFSDFQQVLDSLDQLYLPLATQLVGLRIQTLRFLETSFASSLNYLFNQKIPSSFGYYISQEAALEWDSRRIHDHMQNRTKILRSAELSSGISLVGPHKHDIKFLFSGQDSRHFCSQGQQRAVVLAFLIAQITAFHAKSGYSPMLLLDDVMSELDQTRRQLLLEFIQSVAAQVCITTTELELEQKLKRDKLKVFNVLDGRVHSVS